MLLHSMDKQLFFITSLQNGMPIQIFPIMMEEALCIGIDTITVYLI